MDGSVDSESRRNRARFRFYAELNDFLPPDRRAVEFIYSFDGHPGIKDPIEAIGVPHTEVELILVNGVSVGFDYQLRDGDSVSVYPVFESLDVSPLICLRPEPLRHPAFVLDVHLGKLARRMRMLGFDVFYENDYSDPEIIQLSVGKNRAILTRDRRLLFARVITHGLWLRETDPERQLREVMDRLDLYAHIRPFTRCVACNGLLEPVEKADVEEQLEPLTRKYYDRFFRCSDCSKVYWHGTHVERMEQLIEEVKNWQAERACSAG
jgi:uncharacterized protein with PIN domain